MKRIHEFGQMVRERGQKLRLLAYERLIVMNNVSAERVNVGTRKGTIETFYEIREGERVAVIVHGRLDTWFPGIKSAARDGFYKHRDGSVTEMPEEELADYVL